MGNLSASPPANRNPVLGLVKRLPKMVASVQQPKIGISIKVSGLAGVGLNYLLTEDNEPYISEDGEAYVV